GRMKLFSIRQPNAYVLVTTLATVVALAMASTTTSQKVYAENPALVTLASPLPLPVTGTVGIAGTASVTITNTAAAPVITREIGKVPYQRPRSFYPGPDTCTSTVCTVTFDPVPA